MRYGELPKLVGNYKIEAKEMFFYQYLPIKLVGNTDIKVEHRLSCFNDIIGVICCDFIGEYGLDRFVNSYVYLTAKNMFVAPNCSYNRLGWHSDGFMTEDINYIWSDKLPTVFNTSKFNLTQDDIVSMDEMSVQALPENDFCYNSGDLLRLNQFNIHRVADIETVVLRCFLKLSFSVDKYDLLGNSKNYELDYNWDMKPRKQSRNIPQSKIRTND